MNEKLTPKEEGALLLKAAITAIPYAGGSLATLLFDRNSEKRLKRLEQFYIDIPEEMEKIKTRIPDPSIHDEEALIALIENLNEKIEKEFRSAKIIYMQNFFLNLLINKTTQNNFDERNSFLGTLEELSELECEILSYLYRQNNLLKITGLSKPGADHFAIIGAIGKLKNHGFVSTVTTGFQFNGAVDTSENESVKITPFGKRFVEFSLNPPL